MEGDFDSPPRAGDTLVLPMAKTVITAPTVGSEVRSWKRQLGSSPAEEETGASHPADPATPAEPEPLNDEARQVVELFESLRGKSVVRRIQ
ncbi:MAG: hypothetical protein JRI68_20560, partial [Deltaproteobacteria bacterium]|nr:hypothetical protein [Deltaproteobacteria bacterium]